MADNTSITGDVVSSSFTFSGSVTISTLSVNNLSMNNHGITNLANGSLSTDAAAYGQIIPSVVARYTSSSGQTLTADLDTRINFATQEYDPDNTVTTGSSWIFTAPSAGKYRVSAAIGFACAASTIGGAHGNNVQIVIYKNGTVYAIIAQATLATTSNVNWRPSGSTTVPLSANDTLYVAVHQDCGSNQNLQATPLVNWVCIERVGN